MISFYSQNSVAAKALIETFERYQIEVMLFDSFDRAFVQPADLYLFDELDNAQYEKTKEKLEPCFYLQHIENTTENTIIKPFKPLYLLSKIYPSLICASKGGSIKIKEYILNPKTNTLTCGDSVISLTSKETQVLVFLSQNETGMSKDDLLSAVWGYGIEISTHTLETHIYKLRNKLEQTNISIILSGDKYTIA